MRLLLIITCILSSLGAYAEVLLGFPNEEAASVGIYVKDLATGRVVASNDPSRALLPASVMKAVTSAAAISTMPLDFKYETPVYLYGMRDPVLNNLWNGNLIVEACADPTIDSQYFKDAPSLTNEIMRGLKALGIDTISGNIIVSQSLFQSGCIPEWEIGDVAWNYGAGLYGFNYKDNSYYLWPASGNTRPHDAYMKLSVFSSKNGTELLRGIFSDELEVYGTNPENPKWRVDLSMNDPAEFFISELKQRMAEDGVTLKGLDVHDISTRQFVCKHFSPTIAEILHVTMTESHNLFAEAMLRALAPEGSRGDALDREASILNSMGLSTSCVKICDGSGLARADRLSARFVSSVLEAMAKSNFADAYVSLFPKVGEEGTVKRLLQNSLLKGRLALKSGSMNGVQCFAGYKLSTDGKPTHTVVILVNGFFCTRASLRTAIEKFLIKTFQ